MRKLTVLSYAADADAIVRKLMNLRCVEIRPITAGEGLSPINTHETDLQKAESERRLAVIRQAIPLLAKYTRRRGGLGRVVHAVDREAFCRDGRSKRAWKTAEEAVNTAENTERLIAEKTRIDALMESLEPWLSYDAPLAHSGSRSTELLLGAVPADAASAQLREELEALGAYVEEVSEEGEHRYLAVFSHRRDSDAVARRLAAARFVRADFSSCEKTARAAFSEAEARLAEIDSGLFANEEKLRDLSELLDEVEILCDLEATTAAVCRQKRKLLSTRNCAVLQGWVPKSMQDTVIEALSRFEAACEFSEPEEGEEPPVLLKNNAFATNFEWVIGMYSYPKYGTFDPAVIMSVFYFLIFGLMFADVGYGLLLVLGCFGGIRLLNPRPTMRRMLMMFGYCGISCMLMGVLFGGWFGNLPTAIMNSFIYHADGVAETTPIGRFFYNGLLFNPIDSSTDFLVLSLAVGEIHLIAGMAINMVQTWKRGQALQAVCTTVPFWVLFAGIDLLAPKLIVDMFSTNPAAAPAAAQALLTQLSDIGFYTMFAGFALIFLCNGLGQRSFVGWLTKGLGGLYSLISFASDLLSYSRILALGLVAGVIAQVINMMTGMGASGPFGFVFMLIVMIAGHGLNLAINLLGTFVHAARLQYIEFFGKFYEDGGEPFTPALPVEEYTEELSTVPNSISE